MKIPESVRIGGKEYAVKEVESVRNGGQVCYAHISFDDDVIQMANDVGRGHEHRCQTLWHEILHGIAEHSNLDFENSDEEAIIDTLAKGVYQVLQDNGRRLFDIKEDGE